MSIANMHTNKSQELNDNLLPNITKMLRRYQELNGSLPLRIIMYRWASCLIPCYNVNDGSHRDGVGDGQIDYVVNHEIASIKVRTFLLLSLLMLKSKNIKSKFPPRNLLTFPRSVSRRLDW